MVLFLHMPHQTALALDLASGEFVFPSLEGVAAGLEFNPDGGAAQLHGRTERIGQVALVGGRHAFGLVAVDNYDRRITPALVCIAQLDAAALYHRWLVFLYNFFQHYCKRRRWQFAHGGRKGLFYFRKQITDT